MSWIPKPSLILFLLAVTLTACGYRSYNTPFTDSAQTISVNFVEGDINGRLTESLIEELVRKIPLEYVNKDPDFLLNAKVEKYFEKNVSYTFNKEQEKSFGNEKRAILEVSFELLNTLTGKKVVGPVQVQAEVDFDYDQDPSVSVRHMGVVGLVDMSQDSSKDPLFRKVSEKIVGYMLAFW